MFSVKNGSFAEASLETFTASTYQPFFAKKSRMLSNSCSSQRCPSETKPVQSTKENIDTIATIMPESIISSTGIGFLLLDDYPDPDSPYESDSDDDKLYIDLDPPANYQRRVSVNCFTTPIHKVVVKDDSVVPGQALPASAHTFSTGHKNAPKEKPKEKSKERYAEHPKDKSHEIPTEKSQVKSVEKSKEKLGEKSSGKGSHSERDKKENGKKGHDSKRKKKTFADKSSQTEIEYIIPVNISSVIGPENLEQGQEVLQPPRSGMGTHGRNKRKRNRLGVRDRMWSARDKSPFEQERVDLSFTGTGNDNLAKRQRGPRQVEYDSDMDPPIRTIT